MVAACSAISGRPVCSETGARLHFVDDRLDTLLAIQQAAELKRWNLYMADWQVTVSVTSTAHLWAIAH